MLINRMIRTWFAVFVGLVLPSLALANSDVNSGYSGAYGSSPTGSCLFCHESNAGGQPTGSHPQYGQDLHARLNTLYGAYTGSTDSGLPRNNVANLTAMIRDIDNFLASPYSPRLTTVNGSGASTNSVTALSISPAVGANTVPIVFNAGRSNTGGGSTLSSVSSTSTLSESVSLDSGTTYDLTLTLAESFIRDRTDNRSATFDVVLEPRNASNFRPLSSTLIARNTIRVSFANLKPVGASEVMTENNTGRSGDDWTLDVLANDDDPDDTLTPSQSVSQPPSLACFSLVSGPGTLVVNGSNTGLVYTPPSPLPMASDTVTFRYCPVDSEGLQGDEVTSTILVPALSSADGPTGTPDVFAPTEDVQFAGDVSINDTTTLAGGALSFVLASPASDGTVTMQPDGTFTYLTDQDFNGTDSFLYTVKNAAGEQTVNVTLNVQAANDAPVAVSAPDLVRDDFVESVAIDLVSSTYVTDIDGDTLTVSDLQVDSVVESFRAPSEISYDQADLFLLDGTTLNVFPDVLEDIDDGDFLEITFSYEARDPSGETARPTVTVRINGVDNDLGRTPGIYADSISARYNNHFKGFAEAGNGACLTCHNPGRVLVDIDFKSDCTAEVFNEYGLTLCLDNSVDVGSAGNLAIRMGNAEPQFAPRLSVPAEQLQVDENAEPGTPIGDPLTVESTGLTIDGDPTEIVQYLISRGEASAPATVDTSGNFEISANGQISVAAGAQLQPGSYPIFILPVNDAGQKGADGVLQSGIPGFFPVADPSAVTIYVGASPTEPQDDRVSTFRNEPVTADLLANDTGGVATAVSITRSPQNGTLSVNSDLTVTYTPAAGFVGTDEFAYTTGNSTGVADTRATVSVNVLTEGALLAVDDTVGAASGGTSRIDVLANDTNAIRSGTGATVVTLTSAIDPATQGTLELDGQTVVFQSAEDAEGSFTFTYSATNPEVSGDTGSSAVVTINLAQLDSGVLSQAGLSPELQAVATGLDLSCQLVQASGAVDADALAFLDVCIGLTLAAGDTEALSEAMRALRNEEHLAVVDVTATVARSLGRVVNGRLAEISNGAARGFNTSAINLVIDGQVLPTELVTQMARGFLGLGGEDGYPPAWGLFLAGDFTWTERDGGETAAGYDLESNNLMIGYDVVLNETTTVGVSLGYSQTDTDFDDGGSMAAEGYQVTAYGVQKDFLMRDLTLDGYLSIGQMNFETERIIAFSAGGLTVDEVATADFAGTYVNLAPRLSFSRVLGDYGDPIGALRTATRVTWSAGLDYLVLSVDGYTEEGGGGLALTVSPETYQSLLLTLGLDATRPVYLGEGLRSEVYGGVRLEGELLDSERTLRAAFAAAGPNAPRFDVTEAGTQGLGYQLHLGTRVRAGDTGHLDVKYTYGQRDGGVTSQSATVGYSFEVLGNDSVSIGVTRDLNSATSGAVTADIGYDLRF